MKIEKTLTKEGFFNEMMEKFPLSMAKFCKWIDEYKKKVNWNILFNNGQDKNYGTNLNRLPGKNGRYDHDVKFHDLPYAMQYGIWIAYCGDILSNYFEQPEHISDTVDLEEDIKVCFAELEPLISDVND